MAKRSSKKRLDGTLFEKYSRQLFITNRANVLPILSSGLIRPRAAYEKYYDDLLELFPGRLPLFSGEFPTSLLPLICGDQGMFPVAVEIDTAHGAISADRLRIRKDGRLTNEEESSAEAELLCELVPSPIPLASIVRLCFASQDDLDDFQARDFDNVPDLPALAVVPAVFSKGGPDPEQFKSFASAVPGLEVGTAQDFGRLDSAMGAVAMLSLLAPSSRVWLEGLAQTISSPSTNTKRYVRVPEWLVALVPSVVRPSGGPGDALEIDDRLMAAAIHVLRDMNPRDGWVESTVATEIAALASEGAPDDAASEIEQWRNHVIAVARADKQAGGLDDMGSIVRRGLMLLILRCQPDRILRAGETSLRPGVQVAAVAGMLSGLFHGYSRLAKELKAKSCPVEILSQLAVSWWSHVDGVPRKLPVGVTVQREDATSGRISVTVDGKVFVSRDIRPSDGMMRLFYHAKGLGYVFDFDPTIAAFVYRPSSEDGAGREIVIEEGRPTRRGDASIRIRTTCRTGNGKPIRVSKKDDAMRLLELNHNPQTLCRFAVEPGTGNVEVLVHQILDTIDAPELKSHFEAVETTAADFEHHWENR